MLALDINTTSASGFKSRDKSEKAQNDQSYNKETIKYNIDL